MVMNKKGFLRKLWDISIAAGILVILDALLWIILIRLNFDSFFSWFHTLFFTEGSWVFGADENIIKLYPSGLFYDAAFRIFVITLIMAVLLGVVGIILRKTNKKIKRYLNKGSR